VFKDNCGVLIAAFFTRCESIFRCQVDAFNQEEEAFGWQTTVYPQRLQTIGVLKPYLQLYELTVDFNNKYK
jgi:hypothetical protein